MKPLKVKEDISTGIVHKVPPDFREVLASDAKALAAWEDITPLARNEWICWIISVKKPETRAHHINRAQTGTQGWQTPPLLLGWLPALLRGH